eukprot:TRINITY_DN60675_c0_g1_i1.p1 TRINITY_DN60675_c0_g1~~TRINITY_DN60675_c0_g1_i1.p1  ORF type:complete len:422 (+),score=70.73 TRINITY_DN60675_c0_g1_i1:104-1369(+)
MAACQDDLTLLAGSDDHTVDREAVLEVACQKGDALNRVSAELHNDDQHVLVEAVCGDTVFVQNAVASASNSTFHFGVSSSQVSAAFDETSLLDMTSSDTPEAAKPCETFQFGVSRTGGSAESSGPSSSADVGDGVMLTPLAPQLSSMSSERVDILHRDLVLQAEKGRSLRFRFGSDELCDHEQVVSQAATQNESCMTLLPSISSSSIESTSYRITDREAVLSAVRQDGLALRNASDALRDEDNIVLEAVSQTGRALKYASSRLRADRDFVLKAVRHNSGAIKYASRALRYSLEFSMAAVQQESHVCMGGSPDEFDAQSAVTKSERELLLTAVRRNGLALRTASRTLRSDEEIVLEAVSQNGHALKFASNELRSNKHFVLEAIRRDIQALNFASKELRNDVEFIVQACRHQACLGARNSSTP